MPIAALLVILEFVVSVFVGQGYYQTVRIDVGIVIVTAPGVNPHLRETIRMCVTFEEEVTKAPNTFYEPS